MHRKLITIGWLSAMLGVVLTLGTLAHVGVRLFLGPSARRASSVRGPGLPLRTYRVLRSTAPATFRVRAEIDTFFHHDYRDCKESHYCIRMTEEGSTETVFGYVERCSPLGKGLFAILEDGRPHTLTLTLAARGPHGSPSESDETFAIINSAP